jgi:DNA-directed RNA polymerase specialized sigma24 family protein
VADRRSELEALYRERFRVFVRVATAITGDEHRAYDAVQDGFASAIRDERRFRGEGPLDAWVWRIVVNAALKSLRDEPPTDVTPSVNGAAPSADPDLRARIADLPERQRTVLFLRHFADLDYRMIGDALGISPGTVGATLNAAHASLRRTLEEVPE